MIEIVAVCSHDAKELAETRLVRLLEAEQHRVRLVVGRQSLADLYAARAAHCGVLLVWSSHACSQAYMHEWGRQIDPQRLIEVALTSEWPKIDRLAPPVDFTKWRGERGSRAWESLKARLREIEHVLHPPRQRPLRAGAGFALAAVAALSGALAIRGGGETTSVAQAPSAPTATPIVDDTFEDDDVEIALGGPLDAVEPISAADIPTLRALPAQRFSPLRYEPATLHSAPGVRVLEVRDPTIIERLQTLNPLRGDRDDNED